MLAGFAIFTMAAARNPGSEGYLSHSTGRGSLSSGGGVRENTKSLRAHGVPGRGGRCKRPPARPNHFLSVRIDDARIWKNVLAVQEDIVHSQPHLKEAAIPVQDLHLTLFVATLHEQDGSLQLCPVAPRQLTQHPPTPLLAQRAKEALQSAGDILQEHGLSPEGSGAIWNSAKTTAQGEELRLTPTGLSLACGDGLPAALEDAIGATSLSDRRGVRRTGGGVDGGGDSGDGDGGGGSGGGGGGGSGLVAPTVGDVKTPSAPNETNLLGGVDGGAPSGALESETSPPSAPSSATEEGAVSTMSLSFRGLDTFNDKVLYAHLVEDEQAARLRSLASALHARFSEARLVNSAPSRSGRVGEDRPFDFQPHLTVMKTSKLKHRRTLIPPSCYSRHQDSVFGSHSPLAVELSSMLEREEAVIDEDGESRQYYKCVQKLDLRHPAS